jgi:hypothetical protein
MPKQPKFKVGDVVEDTSGLRGIVITTHKSESIKQADTPFAEDCAKKYGREDVFGVERFDGKHIMIEQDDLKLCDGIQDSTLCDKCEFRFKCWTSRRK